MLTSNKQTNDTIEDKRVWLCLLISISVRLEHFPHVLNSSCLGIITCAPAQSADHHVVACPIRTGVPTNSLHRCHQLSCVN